MKYGRHSCSAMSAVCSVLMKTLRVVVKRTTSSKHSRESVHATGKQGPKSIRGSVWRPVRNPRRRLQEPFCASQRVDKSLQFLHGRRRPISALALAGAQGKTVLDSSGLHCCAVSLHERQISRKSGVGCCEMLNLWRLRLVISLIDSLIGTFINQSVLCRRMMGYTSDTDRRLPSPGRRLVADPIMQVKHGRLKVSLSPSWQACC